MRSILCPMLSLFVCCVLLLGSAECGSSSFILPSPSANHTNSRSLVTSPHPSLYITATPNMSSVHVSPMPNMSSVHVSPMPNMSSVHVSPMPNMSSVHVSPMPNMSSVHVSPMPNMSSVHVSPMPNMSSVHVSPMPNMSSIYHTTSMSNMSSVYTTSVANVSISSTSHIINFTVSYSSIYMNMSSSMIMSSSAGNGSIHNSTIHPTFSPTHSSNLSSTVIHNHTNILPTMSMTPTPVTTVVPTSTMVPTTPPQFPEGKYYVKDKDGKPCLLLWLGLKFTVQYMNKSGEKLAANVQMPALDGPMTGQCGQSSSWIRVSWSKYSFETHFITAKASNDLHWTTANVTITAQTHNNSDFNNANATTITHSVKNSKQLEWLSATLGRSLNCSEAEILHSEDKMMDVTIERLRVQPFKVKDDKFNDADTCNPKPTSKPTKSPSKKNKNTVAIAVGCSLAGLVLIVLIGYFIGKRRSRPGTGYRKL